MSNTNVLSKERKDYLLNKRRKSNFIIFTRVSIIVLLLLIWEVSARIGLIDSFIFSQPSRMLNTLFNMTENNLLKHISVTVFETFMGFVIGVFLGIVLAVILWWSETLAKIMEPFFVVLNSLPKVALGPIIIIWVGAGTKAIVVMALAISLIVTVLDMLSGFNNTDKELIRMAKTFGASRGQIFIKIIFPSNLHTLFNSLKINIGLSLVGVISGEFLVSSAGLGYLIVYGGQVFKLDLVMTSVFILGVVAACMYQMVNISEKIINKKFNHTN